MAQTIRIKRGTKSQLDTYGALLQGEMGFCTDTKEVFIGDGTSNVLVGRVMSGTLAARPNAGVVGRLYFVTSGTDLGYIFMDDGASWKKLNVQTLDDLPDGTSYSRVKKADITNGSVNKVSDGTNTKTAKEIKDHIDDVTQHRKINDNSLNATDLWSAQKINAEIYNAIRGLEWQDSVKSKTITAAPASPSKDDRYLIPSNATGAWSGKGNQIAHYNGVAWEYYVPKLGWSTYVDADNKNYVYNGTAWVRSGEANQNIIAGNGLTGGGQADSVTLTVGAGNGISVASTSISVKAGKGIAVNSTGVEANIDNDSIIYDSANGNTLTVSVVDGGTF
ncbi:Protein of unknown function (DUF2793) [Schinkia azotoformans MEV2011]|uniref:Major tropism determinant N-terminal domain-containing protein n=2 Tax=Schinkia azotoformans TaxID=1454 RepID=A0A072NU37_SCHAZ|nr:DUF2793 domain-containing protein [Schinkia azotoformans]KEF40398.1 Protein of unknown function (DUF2793) [Schinkia azotoformans MEV2011]MEC1696191.1 DUF2793 domain-containing protein [Schinkia azotoformans]MEC1725306.1 DUF2793 domain-containing protein [Schinkia azotoformans]MEC1779417.1 DUF2793 domain-containing protein [Schinkia azotoformans]MED4330098.1 DUF2793 domain-containing protein [Schinkia azotoformans]